MSFSCVPPRRTGNCFFKRTHKEINVLQNLCHSLTCISYCVYFHIEVISNVYLCTFYIAPKKINIFGAFASFIEDL